ncbi:MAG: 3-keto-5-aminohexanoate cleavage protein, partial [Acidimicrobiia bacterium]
VRVGVGDNPKAADGRDNAELVRWAVEVGRRHGREPATAAEVRALLAPDMERSRQAVVSDAE